MREGLLILCFIFNFIETAKAQTHEEFIIQVGPSFPSGEYKSSGFNGGLAERGIQAKFSYAYWFHPNVGMSFNVQHMSNAVNETEYLKNSALLSPGIQYNIESISKWKVNSAILDLMINAPLIENRLALGFHLGLGPSFSKSPSIRLNAQSNQTGVRAYQESVNSRSLGLNIGTSLRFHLQEKLYFTAGIQYFNTEADFDNIDVTVTDANGNSVLRTSSSSQIISALNLSGGLIFEL